MDATTVGVIVGVERDACRVLTNQGRPEKPDVRVALLPDLKRKLNNRKAGAQDGGACVWWWRRGGEGRWGEPGEWKKGGGGGGEHDILLEEGYAGLSASWGARQRC